MSSIMSTNEIARMSKLLSTPCEHHFLPNNVTSMKKGVHFRALKLVKKKSQRRLKVRGFLREGPFFWWPIKGNSKEDSASVNLLLANVTVSNGDNESKKSFLEDEEEEYWNTGSSPESISSEVPESSKVEVSVPQQLTFQVLSQEEEDKRSATPAHPWALTAMFPTFFVSCFVEKIWKFGMPAILSLLHESLLPVAVVSFFSQLVTFALGPWVGEVMDRWPRVLAFDTLAAVQVASMLLSAYFLASALQSGATVGVSARAMFLQPWFLLLVIGGAVERLTGLASGVAIERDWVVQLAGHNRPIALAKANATLRRVDLFCEIAGPLFFGWLLSRFETVKCIKIAAIIMGLTLPVLIFCVNLTNKLSSEVLDRRKPKAKVEEIGKTEAEILEGKKMEKVPDGLKAIVKGWKKYLAQPVLPASLAYVLLNFNAVLSPGGLMTSFLTQKGLDVSVIGVFRGACAIVGFAATFLSAPLIAKLGVLKAGAAALIMQSIALTTSVIVCCFTPMASKPVLFFFLFLVVISRLGHWTYDCVDAQIFQTAIPVGQANLVGTTEISLSSLAELIMLAMAIVVHDVSYFGILAIVSMSSIVFATAIYCNWLANPTAEQKKLFPPKTVVSGGEDGGEIVLGMLPDCSKLD